MLPLSQIVALRDTVDHQWRSPVADSVAAAWGYPPGSALFWRSSARHVFVIRDVDTAGGPDFLRFVPAGQSPHADVEACAVLMERLADRGLGCARVLESTAGRLVETLDTGIGQMHATVVAGAPGVRLDSDDLTADQARAWGAALARVHREGSAAAEALALTDGGARTEQALTLLSGDERVTEAVHAVRSHLQDLARTPDTYGLIHGDFELDNLAWTDDGATAYDWDEAERSWFAADIAYAVRDLVTEPRSLVDRPIPLLDAFLTGYRAEGPLTQVDRAQLVLFTVVNALRSLSRLLPVLAEDPEIGVGLTAYEASGDEAPPLLRTVLDRYADRQRRIASDLAPLLG